jgi:hypothetical protein
VSLCVCVCVCACSSSGQPDCVTSMYTHEPSSNFIVYIYVASFFLHVCSETDEK